jgi:hypothetical protein
MSTVSSFGGHFFVVLECVPYVTAADVAAASDGTLAELTWDNLDELSFATNAFEKAPVCLPGSRPGRGPFAWIAGWNGGLPENTVLSVDLCTGRVCGDHVDQAAAWTRFVLAQPRHRD